MPEFQMPPTESVVFHNLPPFTRGYIEAMFFPRASDPDDELHGCTFDDLSPEALAQIQTDCTGFVGLASEVLANACRADPAYDLTRAGGDFWYTRNGHGVGFWDRGLPESVSQPLDTLAQTFGEVWPYRGDDGKVYFQ